MLASWALLLSLGFVWFMWQRGQHQPVQQRVVVRQRELIRHRDK